MREQAFMVQNRRSAIRLLGIGLGGLVLGSCSPAAPTSPPVSTAPPKPTVSSASSTTTVAPSPQQPKSGGTIRTGQVGDIANLDGHYANQLSATTVQLAYEKLVV